MGLDLTSLIEATAQLGVPAVVLGILMYWIYAGAKWLGATIFVPIRDSHIHLITAIEAQMTNQGGLINDMKDLHETELRLLGDVKGDTSATRSLVEKIHDKMR